MLSLPTSSAHDFKKSFTIAEILYGQNKTKVGHGNNFYLPVRRSMSNDDSPNVRSPACLKFGIERILSDDFSPRLSKERSNMHFSLYETEFYYNFSNYHNLNITPGCDSIRYLLSYSPAIFNQFAYTKVYGKCDSDTGNAKRKRSWSRAVFSNLQRKGLEKRFTIQKYITKPDRRQLAATLGLTDSQVKVWFQNRRMKWRHSKEGREENNRSKITSSTEEKIGE